jgi:hypothetical protein
MSVDWNAFAAHRAELENKILRMERDALATGLQATLTMLEAFRPLLALAGAQAPGLLSSMDDAVSKASKLIADSTKLRS